MRLLLPLSHNWLMAQQYNARGPEAWRQGGLELASAAARAPARAMAPKRGHGRGVAREISRLEELRAEIAVATSHAQLLQRALRDARRAETKQTARAIAETLALQRFMALVHVLGGSQEEVATVGCSWNVLCRGRHSPRAIDWMSAAADACNNEELVAFARTTLEAQPLARAPWLAARFLAECRAAAWLARSTRVGVAASRTQLLGALRRVWPEAARKAKFLRWFLRLRHSRAAQITWTRCFRTRWSARWRALPARAELDPNCLRERAPGWNQMGSLFFATQVPPKNTVPGLPSEQFWDLSEAFRGRCFSVVNIRDLRKRDLRESTSQT